MFHMSSKKLGLDEAVLSGFEGGKDRTGPTKEEVERLLRRGAYALLNEDQAGAEATSNAFLEQDIDAIMERHARVVVHDNTGTGSKAGGGKFAKARFASANALGRKSVGEKVALDDPEFWSKMLGEAAEDEETEEIVEGKRTRTVKNYNEAEADKAFLKSHELEGSDSEGSSDGPQDEGGSGGDSDDDDFEQGEESESEDEDDEVMIIDPPKPPPSAHQPPQPVARAPLLAAIAPQVRPDPPAES